MQSCLIVVNSWRTNTEGVTVWVGEGQTGWVSPGITGTAILSILLEGCGTSSVCLETKKTSSEHQGPLKSQGCSRGAGNKTSEANPKGKKQFQEHSNRSEQHFFFLFFFSCSSRQAVTVTFIWDTISLEFLPTVSGQGDWEEQGEALISP